MSLHNVQNARKTRIVEVMSKTEHAYSRNRFYSWRQCIVVLIDRGYSNIECEAILCSKIARWASDRSTNRYGRASSRDLLRYMDEFVSPRKLQELVDDHISNLGIAL